MVGLYLCDTCHIVDPWFMSHLPHCRLMIHVTLATWSSNLCDTSVFRIVDPWLMQHLSLCGSAVNMTLATTTLRAHKLYGVTLWIQESCDTSHNYTTGPQVIWCHIVNPGVLWHLPQCLCNLAAASCGWFYCSQIQHKNVLEHPDAFCTRQSLSKGSICFSEVLFSMHSFIAVYNSKVHCLLFILGY